MVTRNFGFWKGFMGSRVWHQLWAFRFQESSFAPMWCLWRPGWRLWKLIFLTNFGRFGWQLAVPRGYIKDEFFVCVVVAFFCIFWFQGGHLYRPFARKPWLAVYRAHAGWTSKTGRQELAIARIGIIFDCASVRLNHIAPFGPDVHHPELDFRFSQPQKWNFMIIHWKFKI